MELWCVNLALESGTLWEMKIYYRPDQEDKLYQQIKVLIHFKFAYYKK